MVTDQLLEHPYGPDHPLYLGTGEAPAAPAGAAIMLAATDLLRMTDQGLPVGELVTESRVIARLAENGGRFPDVGTLLDAGALTSARRALGAWRHREGATGPVTVAVTSVTDQSEQEDANAAP